MLGREERDHHAGLEGLEQVGLHVDHQAAGPEGVNREFAHQNRRYFASGRPCSAT